MTNYWKAIKDLMTSYWKAIKDFMTNYKSAESIPILKKVSKTGLEEFCFTDEDTANCLND